MLLPKKKVTEIGEPEKRKQVLPNSNLLKEQIVELIQQQVNFYLILFYLRSKPNLKQL